MPNQVFTNTFTFTWEVSTFTLYFYLEYLLLFYAYDPIQQHFVKSEIVWKFFWA